MNMLVAKARLGRARRQGAPYAVASALAALGVAVTVGVPVALVVLALLAMNRVVGPQRRLLSTAAVVVLAVVPIAWFAGSSLPLSPPAPRIQDNELAHQVGGLGVWLLFLAALFDHVSQEEVRDEQE